MKKTIQSGVVSLTNVKKQILNKEYNNLQKLLHGNNKNVELHSANKQQAKRFYDLDKIKEDKKYPISLRKDLIDIQKCESSVCDYFVNIPTAQRRGGINVPVKIGREIKDSWELCESKLFRKKNKFYLNLTFEIEVSEVDEYNRVIGIDLGLRNPIVGATSVASSSQSKVFVSGEDIKKTQTKYFYLRRNSETDKGWRQREHNKVNDKLHKLTTEIANYAKENQLIVAIGDLENIQNQDKGKAMNRKLHRFPHYSFRQMLEYKLKERGIKYVEVSEAFTSQRCSLCGEKGNRYKGRFKCNNCNLEIDSDVNGAKNIAQRALGKPEIRSMVSAGASVTSPMNSVAMT
ncbi:MAG: IS605 OrfB-like transposable element containing RNAse H-like and Zn finger domain [Candidatus Methanohalarchaeum thermophilum]|uniref:IS605 OrfB-like transposable element containing RNAse H-like and Zn finger domain n=1 Tax=Methanohalarchaeum thermophilum TaxID=1903181 RepID=A0A1Q6DUE2_METT1|nr:MAG: IS605 OrfB-like transposable element containing RNAse H-like and Zn finger domain [Candidatus Methanohalarchaeum thermophilum]